MKKGAKGQPRKEAAAQEKKKTGKKKKKTAITLSYPLVLRCEEQQRISSTLRMAQKKANEYLPHLYSTDALDLLAKSSKKAYKILEPLVAQAKIGNGLTSRLGRGVLEVIGRCLRSLNKRRELFSHLMQVHEKSPPKKWNYRLLIKEKGIYAKAEFVKNIAHQTLNFFAKEGKMPSDYLQLQSCPQMRSAVISYAPDDNQAIRMVYGENRVELQIKVIDSEKKGKFEWITFNLPLPKFLQNLPTAAPDMRLACIHGHWQPVLDYKVEVEPVPVQKSPHFLTVDWGVRKLITVCVFDYTGHQVSAPIFLNFEPLQKKLLRIRKEIDRLKAKRDKQHLHSSLWKKYNREIARRWRKFRAIQKQLAHLAANVILAVAKLYHCCAIHVEWLKNLKSNKYSPQTNWLINSTVRQSIYDKLAYKAKLEGISVPRPLNPAGTSQYCPRCSHKGHHVCAPLNSITNAGPVPGLSVPIVNSMPIGIMSLRSILPEKFFMEIQ